MSSHQWQPGDLRLADDLYLVAHDDVTGTPRLSSPRVIGLGLAGALLVELAVHDHIYIENGIVVGFNEVAPRDALAHEVHDQIMAERLTVHDWLTFFSQSATVRVAERLGRSGVLVLRPSRIPLRPGRWVPTNPNKAVMPVVNLVTPLMRGRPLTAHYVALGGLVEAIGLGPHERVLWEVRQSAPARLADLTRAVSALKPAVRELIAYTERAVASAFVTHRA